MPIINIDEILENIPHRYPFLLIDRVLDYKPLDFLHAIKNVSISDPWFMGHFPETPVMPGVLIVEALAQAAAILAYKTMETKPDGKQLFYLAGIDKAKFKQVVKPGDQLNLFVYFAKQKRSIWKINTEAKVEGKVVCSAEIISAHKEIEK